MKVRGCKYGMVVVLTMLACAIAPPASAQSDLEQLLQGATDQPAMMDMAFVEVTSMTLLQSGQVDFAAAIALDLPVHAVRMELDDWLMMPADTGPRFAVLIDVAEASASRRVLNIDSVASTLFLGFDGAPLSVPLDDPARSAPGFSELAQAAPAPLGGTRAVGQPIFWSYAYDLAQVRARKKMTAYITVVDRVARRTVRRTVDVHEEHRFEVAYRVSRRDPRREAIATNFDNEQAVDDFETLEVLIALSDIVRHAVSPDTEAETYTDAASLRRTLQVDRNRTLENLSANRFDARPLNDPRFDSVVVVYTGKRSMGSGFYVAPNVVMTNWHVVDNAAFVEMKLYDGRETFGTVLGKDAHLDVALVQVEHRGRPVAFYTGRALVPGAPVDAIGHPQRMEFAITRGVVSAVRKHYSINLPKHAGEDVLYVQTDAPISPGNSGGPLFFGNHVVGMNTWGRTDGQNLNFAIHYAELMNFLNEHLPGYQLDPAGGD